MIRSTENYIDVPGGEIWSQIISPETPKDDLTIVFLHGGPGSTHDKLKWGLNSLADKYTSIFYDQLGGGKSVLNYSDNKSDLWTIERFVAELDCLIRFYNLDKFILFGTSWGASLALEYYFSNSVVKKPSALVINSPLVSTKMWMKDANRLKQAMPAEIYAIMLECEKSGDTLSEKYQKAMQAFYDKHLLQPSFLNEEQRTLIKDTSKLFNEEAYLQMWGPSEFYATGTLVDYDRYEDLAKIDVPILFSCGEYDEATPESLYKFHQKLPGSYHEVMHGCSHQAYFEKPQEFCLMLEKFLQSIKYSNRTK